MVRIRLALLLSVVAGTVATLSGRADSNATSCPAEQPCLDNGVTTGNDLIFGWNNNGKTFDIFHIRWWQPGKTVSTAEIPGRFHSWTIRDAQIGTDYYFSISGCEKHVFAKDVCSGWTEAVGQRNPPAVGGGRFEANTNRAGMDYTHFTSSGASGGQVTAQLCMSACAADQRCAAWTFVPAGIQGPAPQCWLKGGVPPATYAANMVSGVK